MSRSDGNRRDDDPGFDPFSEDEDPRRPRRPLSDPLRPDLDPFGNPDPFQLDDPFAPPEERRDPYGREGERTGSFEPVREPDPSTTPPPPWGRRPRPGDPQGAPPRFREPGPRDQQPPRRPPPPPPPPPRPGAQPSPPPPPGAQPPPAPLPRQGVQPPPPPPAPRPGAQPPGYSGAEDPARQAPIPSRAARHQAKKRSPWPFSRGPAAPPPAGPPPAGSPPTGPPPAGQQQPPAGPPPAPPEGAGGRGPSARGGPEAGKRGRGFSDRAPWIPKPGRGGDQDRRGGGDQQRQGGGQGPRGGAGPGGAGRPDQGWQPSGRPGGTTGPFDGIPDDRRERPGGTTGPFDPIPDERRTRPGGTTGPFDSIPDGGRGRPGGTTGPFDRVGSGRPPSGPEPTTGSFEPARPPRSGSTGEFGKVTTNGRSDGQAPPTITTAPAGAADPGATSRMARSRSRVAQQLASFPKFEKFEVPTGLARTTLGLVAILIIATAGIGVVAAALPEAKPPATPATAAPYSARWICPLLPNQATTVGVSNVGTAAATLRTTVIGGPGESQPAQKPLAAGDVRTLTVPAAKQPGYVQVEAFSAPVAVGTAGQASCAAGPTDRWWIPSADTSLGASTSVVVANPDNDPAVVDLVPHVNQGALVAAAELFVPPRSAVVKTLSNGELIALKPAIEVIAKSGRVVAGAMIAQKDRQTIFVPGQATTHAQWSFAGGLAGTDRSTFVLLTNPSSNPLSVSVQVSTDRGTFKPGSEFDNPIPGGASAAIQVPPLRIGGSGAFALRVSSRDGSPFVAALRVTSPTATGNTTYLDLGTTAPDTTWFVPTMPVSKQVVLANLGDHAISARLGGKAGSGGTNVKVDAGKVVVRVLPANAKSFQVEADEPDLLVTPLLGGLSVSNAAIGGVPAGGPVVQGQAAS
jgi:Family of unknown function (DUF5719)